MDKCLICIMPRRELTLEFAALIDSAFTNAEEIILREAFGKLNDTSSD